MAFRKSESASADADHGSDHFSAVPSVPEGHGIGLFETREPGDTSHEVDWSREFEKKLLRKIDFRLLPILCILYLFAFLDRINIGNAHLFGMDKDLKMKGHDFNIALSVFFIPYILLEVPSNLILKKIRPSVWLSSVMFGWGLITIIQGVVTNLAGLVICRVFLGVFEAGFIPGCFYLISMYYRRHELQWRTSIFFTSSIVAGAVSSLLAYAISNMAGDRGYAAWRWIFIIEGAITCALAVLAFFTIVDWPEQARFLNDYEKKVLLARLSLDNGAAVMNRFDGAAVKRTFGDIKIWLGVLMYFGVVTTGYSTSFFLPTILKELGWTAVRAQVLLIPVYVVASVVCLAVALLTDTLKHRFTFTILGCVVASTGYIIMLAQVHVSAAVRYAAAYLIVTGGYITQPVVVVWLANNMGGHYKRGVSSAMQVGLGNLGGIVASNVYLTAEAPTFPVGFGVSLACLWLCGFACCAFLIVLWRENRQRAAGKRADRFQLPAEVRKNLGDDHPSFVYTY